MARDERTRGEVRSASRSLAIDVTRLARQDICALKPYVPGKPIQELERQLGIAGAIKLASNENPLGPSPAVVEAIAQAARESNRYPEGSAYYLKARLSEHLELPAEQLAVGSGSNELIELLCHIFVAPGDEVVVADVTFPMYAIAVRVTGGQVVSVPLSDFRFDLAAMAERITERTRIVFIANPNNPTGTIVTAQEVERFMERVPPEVLVVFDEAYFEYVETSDYPVSRRYLDAGRHVAILRTFSKAYSLAALRVGYALTLPDTAALLDRVRMPFNVTTLGQVAAAAALGDRAHLARSVRVNQAGLAYLTAAFEGMGCTVPASHANFILVRFPSDARPLIQHLEQRGVIVRGMVPFGLPPTDVRISAGTEAENQRLVAVVREHG